MGCRVDRPAVLRVGGVQIGEQVGDQVDARRVQSMVQTSSLQERALCDFDVRYVGCLRRILVNSVRFISPPLCRNTNEHRHQDC